MIFNILIIQNNIYINLKLLIEKRLIFKLQKIYAIYCKVIIHS